MENLILLGYIGGKSDRGEDCVMYLTSWCKGMLELGLEIRGLVRRQTLLQRIKIYSEPWASMSSTNMVHTKRAWMFLSLIITAHVRHRIFWTFISVSCDVNQVIIVQAKHVDHFTLIKLCFHFLSSILIIMMLMFYKNVFLIFGIGVITFTMYDKPPEICLYC